MFFLRVHSVDSNHSFTPDFSDADTNPNSAIPLFFERRGVVHLFRSFSLSSIPSPTSPPSNLVFVVAVPNYFSFEDFVRFCGSGIAHISDLLFIRNDGIEDRYSVLIKLVNQMTAFEFYCDVNGKKFSPSEAEVCHLLFLLSVEYTESAEIAGAPPAGCAELPTCPVCLERLDSDTSGIVSTLCDHSFQCPCVSKWTYLSCQVCQFCQQQDEKPTCFVCGTLENLWVCVICGFVGCGRYKQGHAIQHWKDTKHRYSLDLRTQQIWDYVGDSYVHRLNQNQSKTDGKLEETNYHCTSLEGNCGTCGYSEESGINAAVFSSKVEAIVDEYNHLLATQLETQRQYYESLLAEARSKIESSVSEAVEKAVTSKMQEIQSKLDRCIDEKSIVADVNRNLIKNQEIWRNKLKEIEERETASIKLKDEKIVDLEDQIRDLKVFIEAQKTISDMADSNGIKEGTLLPVSYQQSSPSNTRRNRKSSQRR